MIARKLIGTVLAPHIVEVERGRVHFFVETIGETDPIYTDEHAALDAGYHSLPVPPTFTYGLEQESSETPRFLASIGVDMRKILHGEQSFNYYAPVCVGDQLTFETRIADIYEKKGGALEFIVLDTPVRNQTGVIVIEQRSVFIMRHR